MESAATLDHWRGFVPSKLEAEGGTVGGAIETYRLMLDLPPDDPDVVAGKPLHLPNRWPAGLPDFKPTVADYFAAQMALSKQLRTAFAMALGLPEDYFEPYYQRPLVQLSLLHYRPPASLREEDIEIGAGEHRDTGAFTLLMQDDTGGLEVQRKDGEWIGAPPVKGAYVINIGNVMMRWTNGRFVSTPAPRRQPRAQAALLDPVLRQPRLRRDDRPDRRDHEAGGDGGLRAAGQRPLHGRLLRQGHGLSPQVGRLSGADRWTSASAEGWR